MVYDKVVELIMQQLPVTKEKIRPESRLLEDLGADSANVMILVMDLEEAFHIQVDDETLSRIRTVADVVDYLERHAVIE